ncbi:MAG: DUF58 domain-containing protein [Spirochaetota bacterium]
MTTLSQILKQVQELELIARKNAFSLLSGDYTSTIPGKGLHFHEARKYVLGEPIRMIDWNMTARLGEPYVKVFREEREREVFIAIDISSSMFTGWQDKTKIEYAQELAATIAVSTVGSRDKLGLILFNDVAVEVIKPVAGKVQLFKVLKKILSYTNSLPLKSEFSDIRAAIHAIQKFRGRRFVIFLISDFIDHDVPEDLKYIRSIHDLSLIHVYDPFEYEYSKEIFFSAYSPEGDSTNYTIHPGSVASLQELQGYLQHECLKYKMSFTSNSVKESVSDVLRQLFIKKKRSR